MMPLILVIDDDAAVCWALEHTLIAAGYRCQTAADARSARRRVQQQVPDLVITDVRMPGESGLDLLAWFTAHHPKLPVIVSSAHGSLDAAVAAVQRGAFDDLPKPVDTDRLLGTVRRALGDTALAMATPQASTAPIPDLVGNSAIMRDVFRRIATIAGSDSTVLITGPSGSGKSLAARLLHRLSRHAAHPPIILSGALLGDDPESALFTTREGSARQGTVILDDLTELSPIAQIKLLALLDGPLPIRLITLAALPLGTLKTGGPLRQDLLHRLAILTIDLPPLRERREDLPALARHSLLDIAQRLGRPLSITEEALAGCEGYDWPGNVRELRHRLEEAATLATSGIIDGEHLTLPGGRASDRSERFEVAIERRAHEDLRLHPGEVHRRIMEDVEAILVRTALAQTGGNQIKAADMLGINRITLKKRMDQAGILKNP